MEKKFKAMFNKAFGIQPITAMSDEEAAEMRKFAEKTEEAKTTEEANEEWVWVDGYKGTDRNMQCRGYQFTLGEPAIMPDGEKIDLCNSGFHFCKNFKDVFRYYSIGDGNRFFKVRALVLKNSIPKTENTDIFAYAIMMCDSKMTSKTIILESELSADDILRDFLDEDEFKSWTDDQKNIALEIGVKEARKKINRDELEALGYSTLLAQWLVGHDKYDIAKAVGTQPGLGMDAKIIAIFSQGDD